MARVIVGTSTSFVAHVAGNKVFDQAYRDLQPHVHYARLYLNRDVEEEADVEAEHAAIIASFKAGDGEGARAAVVAHLEAARSRLLKDAAAARARAGDVPRPKKR